MLKNFKSLILAPDALSDEQMVKRFDMVRIQSSDGEIHIVITDSKLKAGLSNACDLNETEIREIMKSEAQKALHLLREQE